MSSKHLVICDEDKEYTARLAAFINGKRELAFQVKIYVSPEQMQEADTVGNLLLLSEKYENDYSFDEWKDKIIILSETKKADIDEKKKYLFKYQSCNDVLMCILENCEKLDMNNVWRVRKQKPGKIIGFYSPVHRTGQTTLAFAKAKELSKEANALYLNLETYSGYSKENSKKNMSTLLYYAKQESGNIGIILATLICSKNGVDYVPPVELSEDIQAVTKEEWLWLFQEILQRSIYDVLVLDIGESVQGLYEILELCDVIYMSVADDEVAVSKIKQYETNLCRMGHAELAERMIRCDIRRTITGKNSG